MTDAEIVNLFGPLYDDLRQEDTFDKKKPLLAHYTTISALEKILASDEIWFSNPLFMNDIEEVRFGVIKGNELVVNSDEIQKACGTRIADDILEKPSHNISTNLPPSTL
jgi:hypothetical protein